MSIEELCEKVKLQGENRTHEDRVRLLSKANIFKENMLHGAKEILLNESNLCLNECKPSSEVKGRKQPYHLTDEGMELLLSRANNKGIPIEFDDNGSCKEFLTELCNKVTTDNKHDDKLPDVKGDELL